MIPCINITFENCPISPKEQIATIREDSNFSGYLVFHCSDLCPRRDNCPWLPGYTVCAPQAPIDCAEWIKKAAKEAGE